MCIYNSVVTSALRPVAVAMFLFASVLTTSAQSSRAMVSSYKNFSKSVVDEFRSSLRKVAEDAVKVPDVESSSSNVSPYLYQMSSPGVYHSSAVSRRFKLDYSLPLERVSQSVSQGMVARESMDEGISSALSDLYLNRPDVFKFYDTQVARETVVSAAQNAGAKTEDLNKIYENLANDMKVEDVLSDVDFDIEVKKPNFWKTSGLFKLQFTQNYFSENWYKGGNNNVTLFSNLVLEANYNDQRRVQWDNKLDMRLGFLTATSDSCHNFITNNDKIYLFSKLGIKATKAWNYTLSLEANTQFMPGYRSNDRRKYSDFLAPLDVFVSLGMDYKPQLKNGNTLSLQLLPFSYKMRYISAEDVTIHSAYNMMDKDFQQDYGSRVEFNSKLQIAKNFTWKCRLYYFTSYKYSEAEMENVFSFHFNKYITSEINTLWRFDDNRSRKYYDDNLGYFQFKEFFTLGLAYNF